MHWLVAAAWQAWPALQLVLQACMTLLVAAVLAALVRRKFQATHASNKPLPPSAPGWVPVLGNSIAYKKDPPGYLLAASKTCGPVFAMDLAGLPMTVVSGTACMKQVALAPSSELSFREAVSDFGFLKVLGGINTYLGSSVHRHVLKNTLYPSLHTQHGLRPFSAAVNASLKVYWHAATDTEVELFEVMRKTFLHSALAYFVGDAVLERHPGIIHEYMCFQDDLENAIANAIVLPRWLGDLVFLDPVSARRRPLVLKIASAISAMWDSLDAADALDAAGAGSGAGANGAHGAGAGGSKLGNIGCWTVALRQMDVSKLAGFKDYLEHSVPASQRHGDGGNNARAPFSKWRQISWFEMCSASQHPTFQVLVTKGIYPSTTRSRCSRCRTRLESGVKNVNPHCIFAWFPQAHITSRPLKPPSWWWACSLPHTKTPALEAHKRSCICWTGRTASICAPCAARWTVSSLRLGRTATGMAVRARRGVHPVPLGNRRCPTLWWWYRALGHRYLALINI